MNRLKKGDSVIVIAGKDKGKKGEILRIIEPDRLIVSNVNIAKKHVSFKGFWNWGSSLYSL